jgi:hypothetical protein
VQTVARISQRLESPASSELGSAAGAALALAMIISLFVSGLEVSNLRTISAAGL